MENRCPISVIMACYNSSLYIHECIESVLEQTFKDFEFIIVDDGSTDNTVLIIKDYMGKDERMRLIQNNHDYISSLNKGIQASRGKYIARMD